MKTALTIAGSDSSGGAGIQADIKTMSALGVYGMSAITALVAENTTGVISVEKVSPNSLADQIDAALSDIGADAIKVGMLPSGSIGVVADRLLGRKNIVIDPVMCAKDGSALFDAHFLGEYIRRIVPVATVFTPNIPEAEVILGRKIETLDDMKRAAKDIFYMGAKGVLVKGGHYGGEATDVFYDGAYAVFSHSRIATKNTHGTGCTLSSAIAAFLARGEIAAKAIEKAKEYISSAIRYSLPLGKGNGPLNHFFYRFGDKKEVDYSLYLVTDDRELKLDFLQCVEEGIKGGVSVVQLREKELTGGRFLEVAKRVRELTLRYDVPLIINDRVDIALSAEADGVHVGQSDMPCSAVRRIVGDRMIVGVTAHNVDEAVRAQREGADYIGVGAMAATGTKNDARVLQSGELERIRSAVTIPIVIIGGINGGNINSFTGRGASGAAVSSAIMKSEDPFASAKELKNLWQR